MNILKLYQSNTKKNFNKSNTSNLNKVKISFSIIPIKIVYKCNNTRNHKNFITKIIYSNKLKNKCICLNNIKSQELDN